MNEIKVVLFDLKRALIWTENILGLPLDSYIMEYCVGSLLVTIMDGGNDGEEPAARRKNKKRQSRRGEELIN